MGVGKATGSRCLKAGGGGVRSDEGGDDNRGGRVCVCVCVYPHPSVCVQLFVIVVFSFFLLRHGRLASE